MNEFSLHKTMDRSVIIKDSGNLQYVVPIRIFERRFELYKIAEKKPVDFRFEGKNVTVSGTEMEKIEQATKDYKRKLLKKTYYEDKRGPLTLRLQKIINDRALMNL